MLNALLGVESDHHNSQNEEAAIAVAQQHRNVVAASIRSDDVQVTVLIDVS
jgi:hypothetical protein